MPRFQFNIRTALWLALVVAALLVGMAIQRQIAVVEASKRERELERTVSYLRGELRRRVQEVKHFEFRLQQMEKRGEAGDEAK